MFALASNDLPTYAIVIPAVIGVDQESRNRMLAQCLKEILRTRARPERPPGSGRVLIERVQDRVLLFSRQAREFESVWQHLLRSRLQIRQTLAVLLLVVDRKRGQATIKRSTARV